MTQLQTDASATSAIWMTPSEIDRLLAATWRTPPTPPIRSLKSDSEDRASVWPSEVGAIALFTIAAIAFIAFARRSRADQPRVLPPEPGPHRIAVDNGIRILEPVRNELSRVTADIAERAKGVVHRLATELARIDTAGLPSIQADVGRDGAFLIEWTNGRRRLGINVERTSVDSSWYYVSLDADRPTSASGPLSDFDLPVLLRRIIGE